jgi:transcriptional antiterminator NusG
MMATNAKRLNDAERVWVSPETGEVINIDRAWQASDKRIAISRRQSALLAAAGMDGPEARWYVLRIENGSDKAVEKALEDANIEKWMPVISVLPPRRNRRRKQRRNPVMVSALPGYIFVKVVSCAACWVGLKTIKGVVDPVGGADRPSPVSDKEITKLQASIEKDPKAIAALTKALMVGDKVSIDAGPFATFEAIVLILGEADRIRVEASLFGREVPIDLDVAQVTKLE